MSEAIGGAGRQSGARGFDDAAGVVDEQGAGAHQGIPGTQHGQIGLRPGRAVMDGGEEGRVQAVQAGEGFGDKTYRLL